MARGCAESADDLTLAPGACRRALLRLDGKLVEQQIGKLVGILVLFQDLVEMDVNLGRVLKDVCEGFATEFRIRERFGEVALSDAVSRCTPSLV